MIGLPLAICVFRFEQRNEREHAEEAAYQLLSDSRPDAPRIAPDNPDLGLFPPAGAASTTPEQQKRRLVLFSMLISLCARLPAAARRGPGLRA